MVRSSNHAVPSPGSSAPKLMFFTLASTGSSIVYRAQSVEPVTPRVCMLSNARTPEGPSTRHHRPAYPRVTPSVLMKPLYRTFFPAARAIGNEPVATPKAGPPLGSRRARRGGRRLRHRREVRGLVLRDERPHVLCRDVWRLHVESGELDAPLTRLVERAHPLNHGQALPRCPTSRSTSRGAVARDRRCRSTRSRSAGKPPACWLRWRRC